MTVQRRADPKKKFESVTEAVAVVAIEAIGAVVDRKLGTKRQTYWRDTRPGQVDGSASGRDNIGADLLGRLPTTS